MDYRKMIKEAKNPQDAATYIRALAVYGICQLACTLREEDSISIIKQSEILAQLLENMVSYEIVAGTLRVKSANDADWRALLIRWGYL